MLQSCHQLAVAVDRDVFPVGGTADQELAGGLVGQAKTEQVPQYDEVGHAFRYLDQLAQAFRDGARVVHRGYDSWITVHPTEHSIYHEYHRELEQDWEMQALLGQSMCSKLTWWKYSCCGTLTKALAESRQLNEE